MKTLINNILYSWFCYRRSRKYHKQYASILQKAMEEALLDGDEYCRIIWKTSECDDIQIDVVFRKWLENWQRLGKVDTIYFKVFSLYLGEDVRIVPEDLCHQVIEPILNPPKYNYYYEDKNNFDDLFPASYLPKTIIRRIDGNFLDANHCLINDNISFYDILSGFNITKAIIKPAKETSSGRGVVLVEKNGIAYIEHKSNETVDFDWIKTNYLGDIIVQDAVKQHEYISQFNPTSVNTLRLAVYRSIKTEECVVLNSIMRIGGKGSVIDNAHAGGCFVGINQDGTLQNFVSDQFGRHYKMFNDIDFSENYQIPEFDEIKQFAVNVAKRIRNSRLLALDIVLNSKGRPQLIEFNISGFSMWLFQFTIGPAFGEYTEEIISYCIKNREKSRVHFFSYE